MSEYVIAAIAILVAIPVAIIMKATHTTQTYLPSVGLDQAGPNE